MDLAQGVAETGSLSIQTAAEVQRRAGHPRRPGPQPMRPSYASVAWMLEGTFSDVSHFLLLHHFAAR